MITKGGCLITMAMDLKTLRVSNRKTQKQVAEELGKSISTISSWENAKSFPDILEAYELAKYYNVELEDIIFLPDITV